MIDLLLPTSTKRLIVYPTAIDTRWGLDRLRAACETALGAGLDHATAVLFHNRAQDVLVLYTLDDEGDRSLTKKLDRGVFLLPMPAVGEKYVVLPRAKIRTLFRAPGPKQASRPR